MYTLYHVINRALVPLWSLQWTFELTGAVDRQPKEGPVILAMNHVSYLDPWFLAIVYPRLVRYLMTERWYYRNRFWQWFFSSQATIPVRGNDPGATLGVLHEELDRGQVIGIFPEGEISKDGRIRKFRAGVTRLAARSGAPVVPAGIRGSFESLPFGRRWPKRGRIVITLGEPMEFPGAPFGDAKAPSRARRQFHERVFREVCRLSGQEPPEELLQGDRRAAGGLR